MKDKWDRRDKKQNNKKKFKNYSNNIKSVTMLADIIFKWSKDGKKKMEQMLRLWQKNKCKK